MIVIKLKKPIMLSASQKFNEKNVSFAFHRGTVIYTMLGPTFKNCVPRRCFA